MSSINISHSSRSLFDDDFSSSDTESPWNAALSDNLLAPISPIKASTVASQEFALTPPRHKAKRLNFDARMRDTEENPLENTPPSSPQKGQKRKIDMIAEETFSMKRPRNNDRPVISPIKYFTYAKNTSSDSPKKNRDVEAAENPSSDSPKKNRDVEAAENTSSKLPIKHSDEEAAVNTSSKLPIKHSDEEAAVNLLCQNIDESFHKNAKKEFKDMLNECWKMISQPLDYSNTYPLFLEKKCTGGKIDVMIPEANVFCFVGEALGRGRFTVARLGVLIHYSKTDGFTLARCEPVVVHHNSPYEVKRNQPNKHRQLPDRYTDGLIKLIKNLEDHPNIIPKYLYCSEQIAKVMEPQPEYKPVSKSPFADERQRPVKHKGLHIGQVSIEPKKYDHDSEKHRFTDVAEIRRRAWQVAEGLKYLHDKGFIHRDLKPDNILIKGDETAIGDLQLLQKEGKSSKIKPIPIGHVQETNTQSLERIVFGYLIKCWLSQYLQDKPKNLFSEKQEAADFSTEMILEDSACIQRSEADHYVFADKDQWFDLYDLAHAITHDEQSEPRQTVPPIPLDAIIEKLDLKR